MLSIYGIWHRNQRVFRYRRNGNVFRFFFSFNRLTTLGPCLPMRGFRWIHIRLLHISNTRMYCVIQFFFFFSCTSKWFQYSILLSLYTCLIFKHAFFFFRFSINVRQETWTTPQIYIWKQKRKKKYTIHYTTFTNILWHIQQIYFTTEMYFAFLYQ